MTTDASVDPTLLAEVRNAGPERARADLKRLARELERTEQRQEDRRARRRALCRYLVDEVGDTQAAVARLAGISEMAVSFERGRSRRWAGKPSA